MSSIIILNKLIIDIIKERKYFNDIEYETIIRINDSCEIDNYDCNVNRKNREEIQHYIFYFLLEYIKLMVADKTITPN
jgi:hypothetical protein